MSVTVEAVACTYLLTYLCDGQ